MYKFEQFLFDNTAQNRPYGDDRADPRLCLKGITDRYVFFDKPKLSSTQNLGPHISCTQKPEHYFQL